MTRLLALLLLGCSGSPSEAPVAPTSGAPEAPAADATATPLAPAPTRDWHGLALGTADHAAIAAWLAANVPACAATPSPMRESVQYRCTRDLAPSLLPDRKIGGKLTSLLLSRPESGPLHYVSTARRYSLPKDAVADFASAAAALTATFGPPAAGRPLERPEQLEVKLGRWYAEWHFADLEIELVALRSGQSETAVMESWEVPGVTSGIASRPGAAGHGAARSPNPHLADAPSAAPANVAPARVSEVVRADGRVYAHATEAQWDFWFSVPEQALAAGDHVLLGRGPARMEVRVEALGRALPEVIDLPAATVVTEAEARARIQLAPPNGGLAIADVYARRDALVGQTVAVRGRIVKASKGIFGTNWYHLQDGTGDAEAGTNDLTVTAAADFAVGDVVEARGPLTKDKDLGFGYFYAAIVENGTITAVNAP